MRNLIVAITVTGLSLVTFEKAAAECPPKTGATTSSTADTKVAKDGTQAPLETNKQAAESNQQPKKDGSSMPLAGSDGSADKNLATSQQDVEAQQKGDLTAAAKADECKD